MKSPWIKHLNQIKKHNPELSYRERVKLAQQTYKKDEEKEIKNYVTREEFDKYTQYNTLTLILWLGLIFLIPVIYSITAYTKNYLGFYGIIVLGFFCVGFSVINYFKQRKKYKEVKSNG